MHDAHIHLDFFPDPPAHVAQLAPSLEAIFVTTHPSAFEKACALVAGHPHLHPALGLIPQEALALEKELPLFLDLLPRTRFVGEIGLDGTTESPKEKAAQLRVFTAILTACKTAGDKILSVHSRRAATPVLNALGENFLGTVILHWFSGHQAELDRAAKMGCYFSVNPAMVHSEAGRKLLKRMPHKHVLLESDGPFVKADAAQVVAHLSGIWEMPREEAEAMVDGNWRRAIGG